MSAEIGKAVKSPDVAQNFANDGAEPIGSTPEEFRKLIVEEVPRWSKIVKDTGMQVQ
jgi:tripartite-type tricarboxylate transporter receptor subunit TctC